MSCLKCGKPADYRVSLESMDRKANIYTAVCARCWGAFIEVRMVPVLRLS